VPHRVTIGDRGLKEGQLEYQHRRDSAATSIAAASALDFLKGKLGLATAR
jgi:prolyl-tRNA synthetase